MNSSSGDSNCDDEDKKLKSNFQANVSGSKSNFIDNNDRSNTETKAVTDVPEIHSGTVADKIVLRYHEISKRKTQRVGRPALFYPNKPDGESGSQSLGAVKRTLSVTYPSDSIGTTSADLPVENSGLEKYNTYMKVRRPPGNETGVAFQNIEFRRIVGQEDSSDEVNSVGKIVDRSDKERKLTSRPPAVGQASSSSNDSGSFALDQHSVSPESNTNSCDEAPVSKYKGDVDVNASAYFENINSNKPRKHIGLVSNRDDYISEKPPEGSSEQENTFPQPDLQAELPRVPSPSSASSATSISVRPLEWDSGADVGYFQTYPQNNRDVESKLSTIERIALARGSAALLTRSDPEGTTEQCSQVTGKNIFSKAIKKNVLRDGVGAPGAESTPFSANILSNLHSGGSDIFEIGDISPIVNSNFNTHNNNNKSSEIIYLKNLGHSRSNNDDHLPLFPELQSRNENIPKEEDVGACNDYVNDQTLLRHSDKTLPGPKKDHDGKLWCLHKYYSAPVNKYHNTELDEDVQLSDEPQKLKKISSSMEFLHVKSSFNDKDPSYTLPRSHSHNNILNEIHNDNVNSLPKSIILRSFAPIKSASSSSVSTVVQRKKDSPKVISKLVQTSFVQQSVGTQASSVEMAHYQNISSDIKALNSLKKCGDLCNSNIEKSSYFGLLSSVNAESHDKFVSRHIQNGIPCSGAHKKIISHSSITDNEKIEFVGQEAFICRALDGGIDFDNCSEVVSESQNPGENCNTLESVESSARSGQNIWTSRRESMGVEDRVNSFEYLPGHVFENTARKGNDSHGTGTSSVSLNNNESSRNEYSDGTDKLWDTSASSTLMRDIERGVNLMSDFVKNSNVDDVHLKQKLIKKVVEKLLRTEYPEDKLWVENLVTGSQWLPSQLHNNVAEACNGRETRRSHNKDDQLHTLPSSEKSSSRASSECFHSQNFHSREPKPNIQETAEKYPAATHINEFNHVKKRPSVQSSSSDVIPESVSSNARPKSTVYESIQSQEINKSQCLKSSRGEINHSVGHINKESTNSSSNANTTDRSGSVDGFENWKIPASKAEKLYEEKLKRQEKLLTDHGRNRKTSAVLLQYLNIERENQLFWIKSEIQHLSNLKRLLEKQEELKKSMSRMRKPRVHPVLSSVSNRPKKLSKSSISEKSSYHSSEIEVPKASQDLSCEAPQELSDWSSHHYLKSSHNSTKYLPREKKKKLNKIESNDIKENKSESVLPNDLRRKLSKLSLVSSPSKADILRKKSLGKGEKNDYPTSLDNGENDDYDDEEEELKVRSRKTVGTETTDTVGVQTSKSVQQLPLIKPEWFRSRKKSVKKESFCRCKKNSYCKNCKENNKNNEENSKKSVAYYITFDESPIIDQYGAEIKGKNSKEKHISQCLNERKAQNSVESNMDFKEINNSTSSSQLSDQKENYEPNSVVKTNRHRLTLQDYLIKNRSDYVSRAEYRRRCVAELAYLRELRDKSKRHLITMAPESSDYSQSSTPRDLPPPPLAVKRVFSQKTMRRQTERKYRQLAEVKNRQLDMKRKEAYRTNRLMAEVFTKKLQRRTLKGEVNLSNSVSVISSI